MSKLARTLALVALLAAMTVTGMAAVAQARPADEAVRQPPDQTNGEQWLDRSAASADRSIADARVRLLEARERFSVPSDAPAPATSPVHPAEPSSQAGWLAPAVVVLVLVLAAGVVMIAARRANRVQRASQTA